jgi:hypothetical protein
LMLHVIRNSWLPSRSENTVVFMASTMTGDRPHRQ